MCFDYGVSVDNGFVFDYCLMLVEFIYYYGLVCYIGCFVDKCVFWNCGFFVRFLKLGEV